MGQIRPDQLIEYQLDNGKYVVVVVIDGISVAEARKIARQRAAEIVAGQGDRYFVINEEQQTEVVKADSVPASQRFPGNLYQELIIEGDFDRERLRYRSLPDSENYPAIRLVFTSYKDKPRGKAIDACKLTECG